MTVQSERPERQSAATTPELPMETLRQDELMRTHAFLGVSGCLASFGVFATYLLPGDAAVRSVFALSVAGMVCAYVAFYLYTRDGTNYTPNRTLVVVTLCSFASVAACAYFGLYSPAPMIQMLTISFFGLSGSTAAAAIAYGSIAVLMLLPMVLIATGIVPDPGIVALGDLSELHALMYAGLVQAVYAATFMFARVSRRATRRAVTGMERALRQVRQRDAVLAEANEELEQALRGGGGGRMAGVRLGPWELTTLLGRGSQSEVYAAVRTEDGLVAALKLLNPDLLRDPMAARLFRREAEVLTNLDSPHVVRIFAHAGGDSPYIAMERLHGEDLGHLLRRTVRLPLPVVVEIGASAAAGLAAAHAAGVVHRDVKPSNLFRVQGPMGEVSWKVLDFGISKLIGFDATVTQGELIGTPSYMAPEIVRSETIDHRADQYGLAAVIYRCLTGRRPFAADRAHALLLAAMYQQPERPGEWARLPDDVDLVLALALAKDPAVRFESITAFSDALASAADGALAEAIRARARAHIKAHPWGSGALTPDSVV